VQSGAWDEERGEEVGGREKSQSSSSE